MKFTAYFFHTRTRKDRADIRLEWIAEALNHPIRQEIQKDGRIKKWAYISEKGRYLRIVVLEDGLTIHNAFFDRDFTERLQ